MYPRSTGELGITPDIGRLLVVDWAPTGGQDKVLYIFDGGTLSAELQGQIHLQAAELRGYGFHPIDAVSSHTIPRLARRIRAAEQARSSSGAFYLEHGQVQPC